MKPSYPALFFGLSCILLSSTLIAQDDEAKPCLCHFVDSPAAGTITEQIIDDPELPCHDECIGFCARKVIPEQGYYEPALSQWVVTAEESYEDVGECSTDPLGSELVSDDDKKDCDCTMRSNDGTTATWQNIETLANGLPNIFNIINPCQDDCSNATCTFTISYNLPGSSDPMVLPMTGDCEDWPDNYGKSNFPDETNLSPSEFTLNVFPNPTTGLLKTQVESPVDQRLFFEIYGANGQLVNQSGGQLLPAFQTSYLDFDLTAMGLESGLFFFTVRSDDGRILASERIVHTP